MSLFSLREAAALIPDARIIGDASVRFERVSTDSRTVAPGELFVALKGERFDAHDFLPEAVKRGAVAALVSRDFPEILLPALKAPDTCAALGLLARGWRRRFALPLTAVVGSNGKTTVKEMIASIFAAAVGMEACFATYGNLNNQIGLPLTLLRLNPMHRLGVVELGMNTPGETAVLMEIAEPTIVLVNNAQREHQAFMKSVEAVAHEYADAIEALPAEGVAVFPADDVYTALWRKAAGARRVIDFALDDETAGAAVRGIWQPDSQLEPFSIQTEIGACALKLRTLGRHNALAATAAALASGVDDLKIIQKGLEAFEPVAGRLTLKIACVAPLAGATVIDDSYNANPDSLRAAIDVLAVCSPPRALVMGDMGEVGEDGAAFHHEIGAYARARGIDALYALGEASRGACAAFGAGAHAFDDAAALVEHLLRAGLDARATILVKGSRFMKMERVVNALTDPLHTRTGN